MKLTVSLLKTALAEESEALHAAQEALDKAQKQNAADLAAKARQEDERQKDVYKRQSQLTTADQLAADTLRLHIRADTNSVRDQSAKLAIRDAVLALKMCIRDRCSRDGEV